MNGEILSLLWGIHPMDTRRPLPESLSGLAPRRSGNKQPDGWTTIHLFCRVYMKQITVLLVTDRPVVHETQTGHPGAASVKKTSSFTRAQPLLAAGLWLLAGSHCLAQIDPEHRNLLELGHDEPLADRGLQGVYAYYCYYDRPDFFSTNMDLRLAIVPVYVDGELGFIPHPATNSGFLDNINLSLNPTVEIPATDLNDTSHNFQRNLPSGSFDKLQPRPGDAPKPVLTVADRKLNYELLGSKDFALKLNLTPVYLNPGAIIPERLVPGLGISIKF